LGAPRAGFACGDFDFVFRWTIGARVLVGPASRRRFFVVAATSKTAGETPAPPKVKGAQAEACAIGFAAIGANFCKRVA